MAKDKKDLEQSKKYDFKNKDENNQPTKVLASGRPIFNSMYDRFIWVLQNNAWTPKDEIQSKKHPEMFKLAKEELKIS